MMFTNIRDEVYSMEEIINCGNDITRALQQAGIKPSSKILLSLLWLVITHCDAGTESSSEKTIRHAIDTFIDVDRALTQGGAVRDSKD